MSAYLDQRIEAFINYTKRLRGDEKGEARVFCDRLFQAFGHAGYKEAGALLEDRQRRKGQRTKFVDLVWRPRLILEMKSRREDLADHYTQAFEYWLHSVPHRPRFVVLCNFDEFWIYEFDVQMEEPMDKIPVEQMPRRLNAFNFLLPELREPLFGNNRVDVTRSAADKLAQIFNSIAFRRVPRQHAQRFILQALVSMFSDDIGLLPAGIFSELLNERAGGKKALRSDRFIIQPDEQRNARGDWALFKRLTFQRGDFSGNPSD